MTDDQEQAVSLSAPDDFLAAVPSLIGMIPEDYTAVLVVVDKDAEIQLTLMVPLNPPKAMDEAIEHCHKYDQDHSIILAMVVPNLDVGKAALHLFGPRFPLPMVSLFLISTFEPGAIYMEMVSSYTGAVPDYRNSELTATAILDGRQVNRTMADIYNLYVLTEPEVLPAITTPDDVLPRILELGEAVYERQPYDPAKVGGLLIFSPKARDAALEVAYISAMPAHDIFAEAGRKLRGHARVEALSAAGLAAYVDGEGIMARHAFAAAMVTAAMCDPMYTPSLAITLDEALSSGTPPEIIAHAVFQNLYDEEDKINDDPDSN